ncbi:MAG: TonB-dependent receptor [Gammaproteobacteria bacterium]|nr:TonB-dependent receptor [Gammaproteobacteria bacterium]
MVSKKHNSVPVGQFSLVELAVQRAMRQHGRILALGALSLLASSSPALAADEVAAADNTSSSSSKPGDVLSEVVVSSQRMALDSAQHIKELSDQIVDSIVAEDIGKLPDRSVMEVLQRVPGISIDHTYRDIAGKLDPEHFQVEGSGLTIRGLTYVRSEINGRDSFTANGGRSLSFDDVPPELLAGLDVFKNPTADQIEGGLGGLVNLRTARPLDFADARISGTVQGTWGDLSRGNVKPSASLLLSNRWNTGIGDIGVLADIAYAEVLQRTDAVEGAPFFPRVSSLEPNSTWIPAGQTVWVPGGPISFRSQQFKRTREGVYTAVQWRPSESVDTTLSYFGSSYKFHWDESAIYSGYNSYNLQPAPGTNFTYNPAGVFTSGTFADTSDNGLNQGLSFGDDTRSADRRSVTSDLSLNLNWHPTDRLRLKTDLQLVRSNTHADDYTVGLAMNVPTETLSLRGNNLPSVSLPPGFLTNPANYYGAFTQDGQSFSHGKEWAWREDVDYDLGSGFFRNLSAGVRASDRSAQTDLTEPGNGYNWQAVSQTWMLGWNLPNLAQLSQYPIASRVTAFSNFFNGQTSLPSSVIFPAPSVASPAGIAQLQGIRTALCQKLNPTCNYAFTLGAFDPAAAAGSLPLGGLNRQDEHTYATYLKLSFGSAVGGLPYDGNVGVRVVRTLDTSDGFTTMGPFLAGNLANNIPAGGFAFFSGFSTPLSVKNDYTDVLPSLNLRLHWAEHLQSRLAISEGMARPDFSQLQAFNTLSAQINQNVKTPGPHDVCAILSGQTSYTCETFTGSQNGHPELRPTKAFQVDGTLEWYFAQSGSLTADVFYKHLTNIIVNRVITPSVTDTAGVSHVFTTTGPVNGARGDLKGAEVAYQQYFDFLPKLLHGFGTQLNFTYINSHQSVDNPPTGTYCQSFDTFGINLNGCDTDGRSFGNLPLANISKYAYNVALLYDRGPVSARLAYSWRSKYLLGTNVYPLQGTNGTVTDPNSTDPNHQYGQQNVTWGVPVFGDAYGELDASVFYNFTSHVTLGFQALNLTDSMYRTLAQQHIGTYPFEWYSSGRTFSVQLRATL